LAANKKENRDKKSVFGVIKTSVQYKLFSCNELRAYCMYVRVRSRKLNSSLQFDCVVYVKLIANRINNNNFVLHDNIALHLVQKITY